MTEPRTYPINTLAHLFPGGFAEFWQKMKMKDSLDQIVFYYVPATLDKEEIKKTLASGGYGWGAIAIAGHFTERYWFSRFEPWPDEFLAKFKTNLIYVIADIRRKEQLWSQVYKDLDKLLKPLKLKTDTRTSQNYDKTQTQGGKTINQANETHNRTEQRQSNQKNVPIYSNVDMGSTGYGGFSRQQQLATQTTEQGQTQSSSQRKNTIDKINHKQVESYRAQKDANVTATTQDTYEWNSVSRLLNNFSLVTIDFTQYYKLFDKLLEKLFGASVIEITDPLTGRRTWKHQGDYQPEAEETSTGRPIIPQGNEWDENLPYLERLQIYHSKNEKEYAKLPDTSNRKPRIALRIKIGEGAIPAYEKPLNLPTSAEFLSRIKGERAGFQKVIGYENIIQIVVDYLENWEFAKEFGTQPPEQLMIGLLGEPGLGKTYISQAIGKALGVGFHMISLNGKKDASIVYGTNIENPGAESGEIIKALSRTQSQGCVIIFDEIEKAGKEAKDSLGNPTDRTVNQTFRDNFYDFPTPLNRVIYFCALNYPEEMPDFINDRFRMIEVNPPSYYQRLEILRVNLQSKIKDLEPAFRRIYSKGWQEIYALFNQEPLLKKCLTKTLSIRGAKDNILLSLVPTLISDFLKKKQPLPSSAGILAYDWKFMPKEDLDKGDARRKRPPCPYASDRSQPHRTNCKCFMNNLNKVPGWRENMEENNNNSQQGGNQGNTPPSTPSQPRPQPARPQPTTTHPLQPDSVKLARWKNISYQFTEDLIAEWENQGFTYQQVQDWANVFGENNFSPQDAAFCAWLRNTGKTPEWVLNYGNLTELKAEYNNHE